ncbi:MAG: hypothetical protein QM771_19700 [Nitrospira sp.]
MGPEFLAAAFLFFCERRFVAVEMDIIGIDAEQEISTRPCSSRRKSGSTRTGNSSKGWLVATVPLRRSVPRSRAVAASRAARYSSTCADNAATSARLRVTVSCVAVICAFTWPNSA